MPPNYRQQQGAPLASHQRKAALVLTSAVVLAGAALGVWELAGGGPAQPKGPCVNVVIASSTGGGGARHCGDDARDWCATERTATGAFAATAQAACRRAGL